VGQSVDQLSAQATVLPWEDAPPPGQRLVVRSGGPEPRRAEVSGLLVDASPALEQNRPVARIDIASSATNVVAIPVRMQIETRSDAVASQTAGTLVPTPEGDFWHATVQQLIGAQSITAMVRELALQAQLVARDTDQWLLRVERESLNQSGTRDRLTTALRMAGFDITLAVEIGRVTDSPGRRNSVASAERLLAAEKIIFDDPFVQSMMRDFGAKIVPGSIKPLN